MQKKKEEELPLNALTNCLSRSLGRSFEENLFPNSLFFDTNKKLAGTIPRPEDGPGPDRQTDRQTDRD